MAGQSDLDRWIEQLKRCEPLQESEVKVLCQRAQDLLVEEGNVQRVDSPVTICEWRCGEPYDLRESRRIFGVAGCGWVAANTGRRAIGRVAQDAKFSF